eukprot:g2485.t1
MFQRKEGYLSHKMWISQIHQLPQAVVVQKSPRADGFILDDSTGTVTYDVGSYIMVLGHRVKQEPRTSNEAAGTKRNRQGSKLSLSGPARKSTTGSPARPGSQSPGRGAGPTMLVAHLIKDLSDLPDAEALWMLEVVDYQLHCRDKQPHVRLTSSGHFTHVTPQSEEQKNRIARDDDRTKASTHDLPLNCKAEKNGGRGHIGKRQDRIGNPNG